MDMASVYTSSISATQVEKTQLGNFLRTLFRNLHQHEIYYAVLRNYESLPDRVDNDVDLWVDAKGGAKFQEYLYESARITGWQQLCYLPRSGYPGSGDFYFYSNEMGFDVVHIDVWFSAHWKALSFVDTQTIQETRQYDERGFYRVSPGVEASILLLKDLLYHSVISERYRERIQRLVQQDEKTFVSAIEKTLGEPIAQRITRFVIDSEWFELRGDVSMIKRCMFRNGLHKNKAKQIKHWLLYLASRLVHFISPQRKGFVVLIGPDGSGKSTIANALLSSNVANVFFSKSYYFHGRFGYLPEIKQILRLLRLSREEVENSDLHSAKPVPSVIHPFSTVKACGYPIYYVFDFMLGYLFCWKAAVAGRLIVSDRYFYDYYLQREFLNCPTWMLDILSTFVPKPDLLIYLRNISEVIFARKNELTVTEIDRQATACKMLVKHFDNGFIVETHEGQIEQTCNAVQLLICEHIFKRYYK